GLSAAPSAEDWLELRRRVEAKMQAEGLDWAELGKATGYTAATIKLGIKRNRPPTAPILAALRRFLAAPAAASTAQASEVAATAVPFRQRAAAAAAGVARP